MSQPADQILSVAAMRAAEEALVAGGDSVETLMDTAGRGAAEWIWRMAGHHKVTVLCGPGNNGGDGYVIARAIRARGGKVTVVAAAEPKTAAAQSARALYRGELLGADAEIHGDVLVDCLFGSGLVRPLSDEHVLLLRRLAAAHRHRVAIDLPSGVDANCGALLNPDLPHFDLTIALGAWKFAHFLMPASATMGELRLVGIGIARMPGAATVIGRPKLDLPAPGTHKYRRGLLAVVGGEMRGAALLASSAAQAAGAGYVKLFADDAAGAPPDLVVNTGKLSAVLTDDRNTAILVGPGLGRHAEARERLVTALADPVPAVIDADALLLLGERQLSERKAPIVATPHDGELRALETAFGCDGAGSKADRALALARESGMVIVAKGPDTLVAAPDGRLACARRASSWLSVAGTGDVLAGIIASRLATGSEAFAGACESVWLHGEAARISGPGFTAGQLAARIPAALAACL